jgi:hypothetical protein
VALVAGVGVCSSLAVVAGAVALAGLPLIGAAAYLTRRAAALTPAEEARGLSADLGPHAAVLLTALGAVAVAAIAFQGVVFEGSGWEGIIRGAIEAGGLGLGVVALGPLLRLRAQ